MPSTARNRLTVPTPPTARKAMRGGDLAGRTEGETELVKPRCGGLRSVHRVQAQWAGALSSVFADTETAASVSVSSASGNVETAATDVLAVGAGKGPRTLVVARTYSREVQGAIGNALAVLKLLLATTGGAERVFEYRCRASAFRGRLDGEDQVVADGGPLAGCRFPSLCAWAKACREELTGKVQCVAPSLVLAASLRASCSLCPAHNAGLTGVQGRVGKALHLRGSRQHPHAGEKPRRWTPLTQAPARQT